MTLRTQEITKDADNTMQVVDGGIFPDESRVLCQPGIMLWWKNNDVAPVTVTIEPVTDPLRTVRAGALDPGTLNITVPAGGQIMHTIPEAYWNKANIAEWSLSDGADTTLLEVAALVVRANGGDGTVVIPI